MLRMIISLSSSLLLLAPLLFQCSSATQFTVGDSSGWAIPPFLTYYTNWSKSQFTRVGDSLEFNFDAKFYNLLEVPEYEYEHCTFLDVVKVLNSSPAIVPLNETGVFFFICNISNYCCLGQKIAITVHDHHCNSSQTPPSPLPSPAPVASPPSSTPSGLSPSPGNTSPSSTPSGSSISPMPSPSGNSNVRYSPQPSTAYGENSKATSLVEATSFSLNVKNLLSIFGTLLGFWVI